MTKLNANCYSLNANPKRVIMLLTNAFDPDPRVHQEAKSLVEHGYSVSIICWDREYKNPPFEQIDGINVERIYIRSTHGRGITQLFFLPLFWLKTFFRIIRRKFDIVHAHDFDTLPIGFLIARLKRKAIVYDAHESFADMLSQSLPRWLIKLIRISENFLIKRINLLITVGSILEKEFKKRGAKRTCVVGNWKNPEEFNIPEEEIKKTKEKLWISNGKLVISFISWLSKERRLPELMETVALSEHVHLVIGGDGPFRSFVEETARNTPNITYIGYVHPRDIPLYTAIADVIVYTFDETNPNVRFSAPNKLFEALAAGKAVITGDFGEIGKIVKEEKNGLILESITTDVLADVFNHVSRNGALREYQYNAQVCGQGRYNWEVAEKMLLTNFNNLIQAH